MAEPEHLPVIALPHWTRSSRPETVIPAEAGTQASVKYKDKESARAGFAFLFPNRCPIITFLRT